MKDKYQKIVELVEINRKTIAEMLSGKSANLTLAQECLDEIKTLIQELYENSQFVALGKALERFSTTLSLHHWPAKKQFTDDHRTLMRMAMPIFGISILEVGVLLTSDATFNRECIEKCHPKIASFIEQGQPLGAAMKKLMRNHEWESLELLIEKSKDIFTSDNGTRSTFLFALIDTIINQPDDNLLEEYYLKKIAIRLPMFGINTNIFSNDHNGLAYVSKLMELGKFELAEFAFSRLRIDHHDALLFFKLAKDLSLNDIGKDIASNLVNKAIRHTGISNDDKAVLLSLAIRQSQVKAFDVFIETDWFPWSLNPSVLEAVCDEFAGTKNANHRKKFKHGITTLIMREISLCKKAGDASVKSLLRTMRQFPNLSRQMESIPELQRQRLEIDLNL